MKRNLTILLVSALLVYTLTGCGCTSSDAATAPESSPSTEAPQPETAVPAPQTPDERPDSSEDDLHSGTDGANTGEGDTIGSGESMMDEAGDAIRDGVDDAADAITGSDSAEGGVAIDDMLRNGRVRDN